MTGRELDSTDLRIISELQKDGRLPHNELANRVGISHPNCLRRVRALRSRSPARAQEVVATASARRAVRALCGRVKREGGVNPPRTSPL